MKRSLLLLVILVSTILWSQNFKLQINAPDYENDSIYFGVTDARKNILGFYDLNFEKSENVRPFYKFPGVMVKIFDQATEINGNTEIPQLVGFGYMNRVKGTYNSQNFFIEKGNYQVDLQNFLIDGKIKINSPANIEFDKLKKLYAHLYTPSKVLGLDSLTSVEQKQIILKKYIKKNPDSYVALWDMIYDYGTLDYSQTYLENIKLFSKKVKSSKPFIEFEKTLKLEDQVSVGKKFPELVPNNNDSLGIKNFNKNKYTLISYWVSAECIDCIKDFTTLKKLDEDYKSKGFGIISVSADEPRKAIMIAKIWRMKNATWQNIPDYNKTFKNQLLVYEIPTQFLVDQNGKIVLKGKGIWGKIEAYLKENLK